ncbi:MAG: carbon starvation protein A [Firmicutes bacterium]|nr:carbon starvation protein A [Bacillota bacterium]
MLPLIIVATAIAILSIGYVTYGGWLSKQWGVDPERTTPAVEFADGVDYVAAPPVVLMGHHFASIAGVGPINGPIQASLFGWVPVFLWCVLGGIFVGGVHDFGALLASIRHDGKSIGEVIGVTIGPKGKKLFIVFALLVLTLVVASFVNVVSGTFFTPDVEGITLVTNPTGNQSTAMISSLFLLLAVIYGVLANKVGLHLGPATVLGTIGIVGAIVIGMKVGISMGRFGWIIVIAGYITVASLLPVWIVLQPRDYLSSYLLYSMMGVAILGIMFTNFTRTAEFHIPALTGFSNDLGYMFPALFITVACGACSGFHSLVATGTSSKQLKNEEDARIIGYGAMLVESLLAIIALVAVGMVFDKYKAGEFGSPSVAFASGIALMFGTDATGIYRIIYALVTLAASTFALTSLDTGTRLGRFMVSELFLKEGEVTYKDATGIRSILAHPLVGTAFIVIAGCTIGGLSLSQIWSLFGAANQLLAGVSLMAIAFWLSEMGRKRNMLYGPMIFMLIATLTSLSHTIISKIKGLIKGTLTAPMWGHWFQLIFAIAMVVMAVILVIEGFHKYGEMKKVERITDGDVEEDEE